MSAPWDRSPGCVLITGSTGGLGQALARRYAAPGRVLLLHGRDPARLHAIGEQCRARGARVRLLEHDLTDASGWADRLAALPEAAAIDLALINAGVASTTVAGGFEDAASVQAMLDVNLRAAITTASALAAPMRVRRAGQIALVSSLAAWVGMAVSPTYCATKAGLKAYGEAMRAALAPDGVSVTVVLPGFFESPMSERYPAPRPSMLSADEAAQRIERGLRRRPARISFPIGLTLGMRLLAVMPADFAQSILRLAGQGGGR